MSEEISDEKDDNIEVSFEKKSKSKRKRKELIYDDSDEDEKQNNYNSSQKIKEESKEEENTECTNNTRQSKNNNNKFNTMDNNIGNSPFKEKPELQKKLKKIFFNRDKLTNQYTKQDLPDNLKDHSDDNNIIISDEKEKENSCSIKDNMNEDTNQDSLNLNNNKNDLEKNVNISIIEKENNINENLKKTENTKKLKNEQMKEENIKFKSYNNDNNNILDEEKNERSNKKIENIFNMDHFKKNDKKENDINKGEINKLEENNPIKKDNLTKDIQIKITEKIDEKNIDFSENKIKNIDKEDNNKNKNIQILKILTEKNNNNKSDNNDLNKNNNNEKKLKNEDSEDEEDKENTLKMKYDNEKETKRRKLIKQIKTDSSRATLNKNSEKKDCKEKSEKNNNTKEREELPKKEEKNVEPNKDNTNNKKTNNYNNHKTKIIIGRKAKNQKPKEKEKEKENTKLQKEQKDEKKEDESENNNINDNEEMKKKGNALVDILGKLKEKKETEKNAKKNELNNKEGGNINELEIGKEDENKNIEKKKEEKEIIKNRKIKEEENEDIKNKTNTYYYNNRRRINNKGIKKIELSPEELKRRKKLEEDIIAEINKKDSEEIQNKKILTSSNSKTNLIQSTEKDEKSNQKVYNKGNTSKRYNNFIEDDNNEIILNDLPQTNLDRSFDAANAYMRRKIPYKRNVVNIYKPKKINNNANNLKIKTLMENDSKSYNPNQNIIYNNVNNIFNSPNYTRNNISLNNDYIKNNHSYCKLPSEKNNNNSIREREDVSIDINGVGLNSSFDTYMRSNINNLNNNNNHGNIFKVKNNFLYRNTDSKYNTSGYTPKNYNPVNYNKNTTNINTYINNNYYKNDSRNRSYGNINTGFNNNIIFDSNRYNRNTCNNNGYFYGTKNQQFFNFNKNNQNHILTYNNNIPLRTYGNKPIVEISSDNENNNNRISPDIPKKNITSKLNRYMNNINTPTNISSKNNFTYQKNSQNQINKNQTEKDISINIEDLFVFEEKFKDIIIFLKKNGQMHNECFEFWNYYYNCSLFGRLEQLFKTGDKLNVQIGMNHLLMSVMICYDYSFEIYILKGDYSFLEDILELNHKNLIIIYEHILSKISLENKSNTWVLKLQNYIDNFNKTYDNNEYNIYKGRVISSIEKIVYNTMVIVQNIRALLKNYKTERKEHLTSIFKKIKDKTYEEINTFFINNILRTDNTSGSVLASVFLKENQQFQTEPAPYIRTKNRKPYSLVLDLDETLIHFKVNNDVENEGILQIRPGVISFLEKMGQYYELIVFTAATQDYGDLLIDNIEEKDIYFEHRFYRQHTIIIGNDFVKDLERIGRPLDKIIIVDNMPQNFRLQKENGINIKAFWGDDPEDNVLEELGKILINIAKEGGDLRIGLEKYKDEIIRKVTSNISKSNY